MRIGIDGRHLGLVATGVENFLRGMLHGLSSLGTSHEFFLFCRTGEAVGETLPASWKTVEVAPSLLPFFLYPCPRACRRHRIDVFYSPVTALPLWGVPSVGTVHDLLCHRYPEGFGFRYRWAQRIWLGLSVRRAGHILTVSGNTRKDLEQKYPFAKGRISVVGEAVDPFFLEPPAASQKRAVLGKLGIDGPYLLTVGTLQPRKNLPRLLEVYETLRSTSDLPHHLVIVGKKGWLWQPLFDKIQDTRYKDSVHVTGYVSNEELRALYAGAALMVLPSVYEGFGLPILEAMACGCPVACSQASAFPEVAGSAALYFDPESSESMLEALRSITADEALKHSLIAAGRERVRAFSWERSAQHLVEALEDAHRRSSGPY